jgi:outer membrane receptor protein involved in Fe transport
LARGAGTSDDLSLDGASCPDASVLYHHFKLGLPPVSRHEPGSNRPHRTDDRDHLQRASHRVQRPEEPGPAYRAALSYITGAHSFKFGFNNSIGSSDYSSFVYQPIADRLNNGIPNQITLRARPFRNLWEMDADLGLFAQDRWTVGRLTLTGGLRFDYKKTNFPGQQLGPTALAPNRNITIPETPQLSWKDVTPKTGVRAQQAWHTTCSAPDAPRSRPRSTSM